MTALLAVGGLLAGSETGALADAPFAPPPVGHVWVINLENSSYAANFESVASEHNPYLAQILPSQGALLTQYFGIGHESLDNYIAQISGQAPNPQTQDDCGSYQDFVDSGSDANGQAIGQGCVFPRRVQTLANQMDEHGLTWKGYQEDMGNNSVHDNGVVCAHPPLGGSDSGPQPYDGYAAKHNPFVYFHLIVDDPAYCGAHDVPLSPMTRDMQRISTTPNLSYITPSTFSDGHDASLEFVDRWLREYVPLILGSPAYRQDGMVIVTFDEAGLFGANPLDDSACCNEIPGPNSPSPGILGPGGGRVGAVVLSPYVRPGTVDDNPYNHYSLLRTLETLFHITTGGDDGAGHLGYAGTYTSYPGPGEFGNDVYTANRIGTGPPAPGPAGGTRAADGSTAWANPGPQGNDLHGISCASDDDCVAVGDGGAVVTSSDGQNWDAQIPPTGESLRSASCRSAANCVTVGDKGTIFSSDDAGLTWSSRSSGTSRDLTGVSCPDADRCVAVGEAGTALASGDGGATWTARSSGTGRRLAGVDCATAARCVAVGELGTIVTTDDGGATWVVRASPSAGRLFAVSCTSADSCIVAIDNEIGTIFTNDGGATWQNGQGSHGDLLAGGVACAHGTTACLLLGQHEMTMPVYADGNQGHFDAITPTGASAGQRTFTPLGGLQRERDRFDALRAASCSSAARCTAVGAHGEILSVSNLPQTSSDPKPTFAQRRSGLVRELTGVSCTGEGACQAVGDSARECLNACQPERTPSTILATTDGMTWTPADPGTSQRLNAVTCAGAVDCVAVGDLGTVVRTQDGTSWAPVSDSGGVRGASTLLGVSCPRLTNTCVAVGDHGAAFRSGDGGGSWSAANSGTAEYLNAVSCASASACIAVGAAGTIVRSSDGGGSWTSSASGTDAAFFGVSCPTSTRCVAVGADGAVRVSSDGGASWTSQSTPAAGADLLAVSCVSASNCVASGSDGTVLTTSNGGAAWTARGTGTLRALTGVSCVNTATCFEVGQQGTILRPPTPRGFPRPKSATPLRASLVLAFQPCGGSSNSTHGAPLAYPSCRPPAQVSPNLTVGTVDANGNTPNSVGFVRLDALGGDVQLSTSITDVRRKSNLAGYSGEVMFKTSTRISDRLNGSTLDRAGTVEDIPYSATVPCTAGTCAVSTSFNALAPGEITAGKRAIWQLGRVEVYDGGADGLAGTADNSLFEVQGIFVP